MNWIGMIDKIDDILYAPIDMVTSWVKEPIEMLHHRREIVKLKVESEIHMNEKKLETELRIKRETEVVKKLAEIEELKKDKALSRMEVVSEAIIKYQKELTRLNSDAISAIGTMQTDLREKASKLVDERNEKYIALRQNALKHAREEFMIINQAFADSEIDEIQKQILDQNVGLLLADIIKQAGQILHNLFEDMNSLNTSIDLLAQDGRKFIEIHSKQLLGLGVSEGTLYQLKDESSKQLHE